MTEEPRERPSRASRIYWIVWLIGAGVGVELLALADDTDWLAPLTSVLTYGVLEHVLGSALIGAGLVWGCWHLLIDRRGIDRWDWIAGALGALVGAFGWLWRRHRPTKTGRDEADRATEIGRKTDG